MDLTAWMIYALTVAFATWAVAVASPRTWPTWLRRLVIVAVVLRAATSLLRIAVYLSYGNGDGLGYYRTGLIVAERLYAGAFPLYDTEQLWGTPFIARLSGVVVGLTAGSMPAAFFLFALAALTGLLLIVHALVTVFPHRNLKPLAFALLLWPSIAFWPSGIGKEAVVVLGIGIVFQGVLMYTGVRRIAFVAVGLLLASLVRPHIAVLVSVAVFLAELAAPRQWTSARLWRTVLLLSLVLGATFLALRSFGLDADDPEAISAYVSLRSEKTSTGKSLIAQLSGPAALLFAPVNIFLRPFLWEVTNVFSFLAGLETLAFAGLAARNWRRLRTMLTLGWSSSCVRLSSALTLVLTLLYGGYYANLGILVRQKVVVFIFAVVLLMMALSRPKTPVRRQM